MGWEEESTSSPWNLSWCCLAEKAGEGHYVTYHMPQIKVVDCLQKGPYFKDLVLNKDLFGILGPYWVLINI